LLSAVQGNALFHLIGPANSDDSLIESEHYRKNWPSIRHPLPNESQYLRCADTFCSFHRRYSSR
jgi:hypothetical protein